MKNEIDKGQISDGYHTFDELYRHRHALFLNLLADHRGVSWASKVHSDGTSWDGWFIAGIETPKGQISYHLPDEYWPIVDDMGITRAKAPAWDGHTSEDVYRRLLKWVMDRLMNNRKKQASIREIQDWMRKAKEGDLMKMGDVVYRMKTEMGGLWIRPVPAEIKDFG